jgi:two-component system nitrogen regulation sensor histidine kinase NtrY
MPRRLTHDQTVFLCALLAGLPAVALGLSLLWSSSQHHRVLQWTFSGIVVAAWFGFSIAARCRVTRPLQTTAKLLSALREGDFSVRAPGARRDDPLGAVMAEINALGQVLQQQRLGALEATALLRTVMEEIDVAILAFDSKATLRLVNRAGQQLLGAPAEHILGRSAADVGLAEALEGDDARVLTKTIFPGGTGRWGMRRTAFREGGLPHQLLVIADLSQALREEELKAWQRLVRVLGHELNNSLAPIKSIAGSLSSLLKRNPRAADWETDMRSGLDVIAARADGLSRFMEAYARLARLPSPTLAPCPITTIVHRVVALERRLPVRVLGGPSVDILCDEAQIDQVLINLIRNAVEAALETDGGVRLAWRRLDHRLELTVEDDGPGLANSTNLFVPFFTTKPEGSGIGLVLCRQIAENHGGSVRLENRPDRPGSVATLSLPLASPS